jgi:AraC family transcriptional regulator
MKRPKKQTELVFARPPSFSIHYRKGRRLQWGTDARVDYGLLVVLAGRIRWRTRSGDEGELTSDGALIVAPGDALHASCAGNSEFIALTLSPVFVLDCAIRAGMIRAGAFVTFPVPAIESDARLGQLARALIDELTEESIGQDVVLAAIIEQTLVHSLRRYGNVRRSDELELSRAGLVDRRVRRAVELMHANLNRDLPLETIAAAAHLSPFHFARLFKKLTGVTPHAYLGSLRVAHAQKLLAETDLSIIEVGSRVGYSSPSHFAKAFRQAFGISPRAFRQALR